MASKNSRGMGPGAQTPCLLQKDDSYRGYDWESKNWDFTN